MKNSELLLLAGGAVLIYMVTRPKLSTAPQGAGGGPEQSPSVPGVAASGGGSNVIQQIGGIVSEAGGIASGISSIFNSFSDVFGTDSSGAVTSVSNYDTSNAFDFVGNIQ